MILLEAQYSSFNFSEERAHNRIGIRSTTGGILSSLIFIIYGADMAAWLRHSAVLSYADDTSTSVTGKTIEEVISKLQEDAEQVLKFMASNGLVANPTKTTLLILNNKNGKQIEIKVGQATIKQEQSAKLLGIKIEDSQKWNEQINGVEGTISSLNQRLYLIRRLKK